MRIDKLKCIGCGKCIWYCTKEGVINLIRDDSNKKYAEVDESKCLECGNCLRVVKCPTNAIFEPKENNKWPRSIRKFFSDPKATHQETLVPGRGTEECKTNDVTNRISLGKVGVSIEFGRPNVGADFFEIEKMTKAMAKCGVKFIEANPFTYLMEDKKTGVIRKDVKNEKILSGILEMIVLVEKLYDVLKTILDVELKSTVFSLDIMCRYQDSEKVAKIAKKAGVQLRHNAKINLGMGTPLIGGDRT